MFILRVLGNFPTVGRVMNSRFLTALLVPIARWGVRRSVPLQDGLNPVKISFLIAAEEELPKKDIAVSDARLSAMTGVPRKDIKRGSEFNEPTLGQHPLARVLSLWQNDPRVYNKRGLSKILSLGAVDSVFSQLVPSVASDTNPYSIVSKLERTNSIKKTPKGFKFLRKDLIVLEQATSILSDQIADSADYIEENTTEQHTGAKSKPKNLQLKPVYDAIPKIYAKKINAWLMHEGSLLHQKVRNFLSAFDVNTSPQIFGAEEPKVEISLSAFSLIRKRKNQVRIEKIEWKKK